VINFKALVLILLCGLVSSLLIGCKSLVPRPEDDNATAALKWTGYGAADLFSLGLAEIKFSKIRFMDRQLGKSEYQLKGTFKYKVPKVYFKNERSVEIAWVNERKFSPYVVSTYLPKGFGNNPTAYSAYQPSRSEFIKYKFFLFDDKVYDWEIETWTVWNQI